MLASDIVNAALRKLGAIASGETPNSDEASDGFNALLELLDSWSGDELLIFATTTQAVSLTSGTSSYTLGTRPVKILGADVTVSGVNMPVQVVGPETWSSTPDKTASSPMTKRVFCDYQYPSAAIHVAPVPNTSATLNLYCTTDLPTLANAGATFAMPEAYTKAIIYNLAVDLAPEYGREPSPSLMRVAMESKDALRKLIASDAVGKSELELPSTTQEAQ